MFWFKNAIIYRLTKLLDWDFTQLQNQLSDCAYAPCGPQDISKFGWVSPLRGSDLLHFSVGNQILLVAQKEEKILPAQVVDSELNKRIAALEEKEHMINYDTGKPFETIAESPEIVEYDNGEEDERAN